MSSLVGFLTLVRREIYRFTSVFTQTIFPPVVSSFLYIFIFGFSLGARIQEVQGVPYLQFLIPGLLMMYIIEGSYQNTSSSLFISRWANNIEELLVTPLAYIEMVFAMLIGGLARSIVTALGAYCVSLLFVRFPLENIGIIIYFLIFVSLIFSSIGMTVALFAEEFEHLTIATTFVITPLIFFGGVFHSIEMMPNALKWITAFNPMFYMVNGLRYGMLGITDAPVSLCMTVIFCIFIASFFTNVFLFKIGFKLRT